MNAKQIEALVAQAVAAALAGAQAHTDTDDTDTDDTGDSGSVSKIKSGRNRGKWQVEIDGLTARSTKPEKPTHALVWTKPKAGKRIYRLGTKAICESARDDAIERGTTRDGVKYAARQFKIVTL